MLQAIMMVESADGRHALLGRSRGHRPGMLTCLSGFIDQSESIGKPCSTPRCPGAMQALNPRLGSGRLWALAWPADLPVRLH